MSRLDQRLRALLDAAEAHGKDDDPEMEIGDLQGFIMSAWRRLTPAQRREVYDEHASIVEHWGTK